MKRILFADNDPDFLSTRAEYLERAGFHVYKATSLIEAENYLRNAWIHLAILDMRMTDDDDEKDVSGMTLISADFANKITKIVLTSFNTPLVRDLVRIAQGKQSLALDVIEKAEGPSLLIAAVNDAFTKHIQINWKLAIDWRARDSFSLIRLIESNLEGESLLNRAEEFEDLFRQLFYEDDYIRIDRLLWKGEGRVALIVFAFREGMKPESYVVVCGRNSIVNDEAKRFEQFAPNAPSDTGTRLTTRTETTHYAVNAYSFAHIDLEKTQSLRELYRTAIPSMFKDTLTTLLQKTLADWHQEKLIHVEKPLSSLYQDRLQLTDIYTSQADFEGRLRVIEKRARDYNLIIKHNDEEVSFVFGEKVFSYPAPLQLLFNALDTGEALIITVPGLLTGQNILTNGTGQTWLTDFSTAGQAPLFWNYVALEAAIRFDWTDADNFLRRKELEECLVNGDFFKPDIRSLERDVHKPAEAIVILRGFAKQASEQKAINYHLGLFYQASRFLLDYSPAVPLQLAELMRLVHIYLSMAMLTERIISSTTDDIATIEAPVLGVTILDKKARSILVGAREVRLRPQDFAVFEYLFMRAGEVCTKEELVNNALKGGYEEEYIQTIVMRIRMEIEDDRKQPRYLINIPYSGYRLIINPK